MYTGINKIVFENVARLSLRRVRRILRSICGNLHQVKIYRIDWAVDLPGLTPSQLHQHCRVSGVQKSAFFHSRTGDSFYPHMSDGRTILIYDRSSQAKSKGNPPSHKLSNVDTITRVEVQFRGNGVPIREFTEIGGYADVDLLKGVTFLQFRPLRRGLKPLQLLAAMGMQSLVQEVGLQNAAKRFSAASNWAYLSEKFFEPVPEADMPDVRFLMQESARDWLENRRRFARLG
jgi:hypothetical protein